MSQHTTAEARSATIRTWLLALGMFAIGTDLFIVSGLLPALGHDLGLSMSAAGQTVTVFAITYAVASPILTGLTARLDRRLLLGAVLAVFAAGNVLSAVAPDYSILLVSRFVAGLGAALYAVTASGTAARITAPERRGRALAIVYAGMTSAIALGVPIGDAIGNALSWRWAFGFVAALAVATGIGLVVSLPALPGTTGIGLRERVSAIRIRRAPTALTITMLWVVGTFVTYTYLGSIFDSVTHVALGDRPWLLLLFGIGSFAGVLGGGRLADRVNPTAGLACSIGLLILVLAALGIAFRSTPGAAIGVAVWGLVHWVSFPLIQHRLIGIGGKHADMLLALNNSAVYLGQTIAAVVGGLLTDLGALAALPFAGAGFELIALVLLAVSAGSRPRSADPIDAHRQSMAERGGSAQQLSEDRT
ncbi:MFS transporter [Nocardia panacis]|uniref:MFS transporter n=1 Tax=Nocardia panacis TaxID=2340916 RepID=A0A3A4KSY4_9NOCA|nr:MFS transporter [Nocardia panacis]RJO78010.1 MFS transporter [Nocardia panacis]